MRVVFMGTPEISAAILDELAEHERLVGVYTRPDAVRGRGKGLVPSPVKEVALRRGIPVHETKSLRDAEVQAGLSALEPDVVCVAAFGAILPPEVLAIPRFGCLNVHASLLPRWRGAAPVERAILAGDERTGVSIMRMEEGLDTGDYCLEREVEVGDKDLAQLTSELASVGAAALVEALDRLESGDLEWTAQDESRMSYASKIGKRELWLSPDDGAEAALRKVRASNAAHPSRLVIAGRPSTMLAASCPDEAAARLAEGIGPGEVRFAAKRLLLGCADGAIEARSIKPDGKKPMDGPSFAAGVQGIKREGARWEADHA